MDVTLLSPHFSYLELTRSDTGLRLGIDNIPTPEHLNNLILVCENVLEPVRKAFGPVRVNSGYRCLALNMAINPMTSTINKISKHCTGQAVDFEVDGIPNATLAGWCVANLPDYEQIILEFYTPGQPNSGWVHTGYVIGDQKKQVFTAVKENGSTVYKVGILL
jgi:zinc D-Ala-D-Ala carboxypeptidase